MNSELNKEIAIQQAIIKVCAEVLNPKKNKQGYGYKYAELSSILDMLRPILAKYELAILQPAYTNLEKQTVTVATRVIHSQGGVYETKYTLPVEKGKMTAVQSVGATTTYARRYSLCNIFGIAGDEDTDGAEPRTAQRPQKGGDILSPPKKVEAPVQRGGISAEQVKRLIFLMKTEKWEGKISPMPRWRGEHVRQHLEAEGVRVPNSGSAQGHFTKDMMHLTHRQYDMLCRVVEMKASPPGS